MTAIPTLVDGPCEPWPVDMACHGDAWVSGDYADPVVLAEQFKAVAWASTMLWKRTRRRYGVCSYTLHVCPPHPCYCTPCRCGPRGVMTLIDKPITSITSVTDVCSGEVIAPSRYKIVDAYSIGLVDQTTCSWTQTWGCDLAVVFTAGLTPDDEAIAAVSELAFEYLKYCRGEACKAGSYFSLNAGAVKRGKGGRRDVTLFGLSLVDRFILEATTDSPSGMLDPAHPGAYSLS